MIFQFQYPLGSCETYLVKKNKNNALLAGKIINVLHMCTPMDENWQNADRFFDVLRHSSSAMTKAP